VLLSLVRNVSWLTAGLADSHIVITSEAGAASLLVMDDGKRYVLASNSEMARLLAEDLAGLGFEPREYKWYADKTTPDERMRAIREIAGLRPIGSDTPMAGLREIEFSFAPLRYVLTETEIAKYRWLGRNATEAVAAVCRRIRPGVTERDMEAMASDELMRRGIRPTVLLMGADERVLNYRHTVPSDKPLTKYAFVNVCARRWGLVVSTGRFVHFGPVPEELRKRVRASAFVTAHYLSASKLGVSAGSILEMAKEWFAAAGFPAELELHHQGGAIGYVEREWVAFPGSREVIHDNQAFAWNPIVQGALSFDTFVLHSGRMENLSEIEDWPKVEVEAGGVLYRLPDILVRQE
jgi:antitoxin VapB